MKRLLHFIGFVSVVVHAQHKPFTVFDTIAIDQVVVVRTMSLNDGAMVDKHQSTYFSSLDKINSRLSGVNLVSRGAYALEPFLHSFSSGQINLTIDGMKMFGACTDKMDPVTSYVEPVNLNHLNIWHGSTGSRYGSTVGGSYDMKLESAETGLEQKWQTIGGVGYETIAHGKNAQGIFHYSGKKLAWRMNSTYKDYHNYTDGEGITVPFTHYKKVNLHSSFLYKPSPHQSLEIDFLLDNAYNIGYPALPMDVSTAKGRMFAIEYNELNSFWNIRSLKVKLYFNTVYHLMDDSQRDSLFLIHNNRTGRNDSVYMRMDMPGWSDTFGVFAEGAILAGEKHRLDFRIDNYFNYSKAEMTMFMRNLSFPGEPPMYAETWPKNYRQVTGLFLRDLFYVRSFFQIEFNSRFDYSSSVVTSEYGSQQFQVLGYHIDKPYHRFLKSINLNTIFRPQDKTKLVLGIGYGERLPTLSEQFGFYLFNAYDGYDYIGNPNLKLEKSSNIFLNYNYTKKHFKLQILNYLYFIDDYIIGLYYPDLGTLNLYASGVKKYMNIPSAKVFSTSFQGQWDVTNSIEFFGMFKYIYGEIQDEPIPLIPPVKSLFSITYLKENYFLIAETELSPAKQRINESFGESKTDGYAIFNLRSGVDFKLSDTSIRLSIGAENVLNATYQEHLDWGNYNRPGRNFYINLRIAL
jgi:iron complex outermembrane receptor protein